MARDELDLAYRILDLDLVDSDGRRCGKVDDLELDGSPGEPTHLAAIRAGPGAMPARFPRRLRRLGAWIFRGGSTRIAWSTVDRYDSAARLTQTAAQLGLGKGDRRLAELVPGGDE